MLYIILRGHWFHIIALNVHAPAKHKIDYVKDSFYEQLECVFDKFPKFHTKILLGDFNAKVGRDNIFKPTGNESLHEINNDIGVRAENVATTKNLTVKSTVEVHCNNIFEVPRWETPQSNCPYSDRQLTHIENGDVQSQRVT
jgi:hypothetical protein